MGADEETVSEVAGEEEDAADAQGDSTGMPVEDKEDTKSEVSGKHEEGSGMHGFAAASDLDPGPQVDRRETV